MSSCFETEPFHPLFQLPSNWVFQLNSNCFQPNVSAVPTGVCSNPYLKIWPLKPANPDICPAPPGRRWIKN